jgi:hypothetical protein
MLLRHIPKLYPRRRKNPALKRSPGFFQRHFGILGYALRLLGMPKASATLWEIKCIGAIAPGRGLVWQYGS